jgi:hypothetical protein
VMHRIERDLDLEDSRLEIQTDPRQLPNSPASSQPMWPLAVMLRRSSDANLRLWTRSSGRMTRTDER